MNDPSVNSNPEIWKKRVIDLTSRINAIVEEYESILNEWEDARNEAGDPGKHDIDEHFTELSNARDNLSSLSGGSRRKGRSKRKQRRTRKYRG